MNPIIQHMWTPEERARYGIRVMKDFSAEELVLLETAQNIISDTFRMHDFSLQVFGEELHPIPAACLGSI
jgi:hypothetical protein